LPILHVTQSVIAATTRLSTPTIVPISWLRSSPLDLALLLASSAPFVGSLFLEELEGLEILSFVVESVLVELSWLEDKRESPGKFVVEDCVLVCPKSEHQQSIP
jgi:hypothetical protein